MSCENCKKECKPIEGTLEEMTSPAMVPLYAVESQGFRRERTIRGTVILFCVALLVISILVGVFGYFAYQLHAQSMEKVEAINRYWLDFLGQYDIEGKYTEYSQDGRGINIIGDSNGVTGYEPETGYTDESYPEEGR